MEMTNQERCIYCESSKNLSRDHIPPKNLFPASMRDNLITVPCCVLCNNGFSKAEEYFRVIISTYAGAESNSVAKTLFETKIRRGLERRPKLASKVMSTVVSVDIYSKDKKIGVAPAYDIETPEFNIVMAKIFQGLLFHETSLLLPKDYTIEWNIINDVIPIPERIFNILCTQPIKTIGNGIFRYMTYILPGSVGSFWVCSFYDAVFFHGGIMPKDRL